MEIHMSEYVLLWYRVELFCILFCQMLFNKGNKKNG